ncbi:proteasome-type protease [Leptothermofonsia sichuanensis]|uniref:proteasome-type protease n=1 Tax=Leptothermofonsia sichuanensis TaxID=2917832 RepID=UPI001CEDB348|nr:proteasome-type protease [Leptothermofonsia sichuanensis]
MTYCLGIITQTGLVMAADSRTHAGVDNISTYRKLFSFAVPGDRVIILCTSGSLSLTQAVLTCVEKDIEKQAATNLYSCKSLYDVAGYIGGKIRELHDQHRAWLKKDGIDFSCRFLLGGQIQGDAPKLYLIYNQGNFIQATPETPFLQIGEIKYGKPILDYGLTYSTSLDMAARLALISIDSTMRSNLSVGPPINLVLYESDRLIINHQIQLDQGSPYLLQMDRFWETVVREAAMRLPDIRWQTHPDPEFGTARTGIEDDLPQGQHGNL